MKQKKCWVELGVAGNIVRIFRETKDYLVACCRYENADKKYDQVLYAEAVSEVRSQVWKRSKGHCEKCGEIVTEQSGQLHEIVHRGQMGEISLDNSVFLCHNSHREEHSDREPQWTR